MQLEKHWWNSQSVVAGKTWRCCKPAHSCEIFYYLGIERFIQNESTSFSAHLEGFLGDSLISWHAINIYSAITL